MKRTLSLIATMLALTSLACNSIIKLPISSLKTIPTETFSIDEPLPASEAITDVTFAMAASTATLKLAGGADGLIEGEIQYNVAEWKPTHTISNGALLIEQNLPEGTIVSALDESTNQWDMKLGIGLQNVQVNCSSGNFTVFLTDTLPDAARFRIEMGTGNLRLIVPTGAAASVNVNSGPVSLSTEGAWMSNGNTYTTGGSNPTWIINVEMGVGKLTLASE